MTSWACASTTSAAPRRRTRSGRWSGLAWTEVGGDLLTIEATVMPGKGNIIRTGSLGDVMKESVEAARTVVRSRARRLGLKDEIFEKRDIHIHVPDGATPKDGPSAGAAMTTALVSALSGIPVRADVAMTGEITLRGEVTAIGGLKEKLLAAHRGGVKTVLIPGRERQGPAGHPGERQEQPGDRAGALDRPGASDRSGTDARGAARRRSRRQGRCSAQGRRGATGGLHGRLAALRRQREKMALRGLQSSEELA